MPVAWPCLTSAKLLLAPTFQNYFLVIAPLPILRYRYSSEIGKQARRTYSCFITALPPYNSIHWRGFVSTGAKVMKDFQLSEDLPFLQVFTATVYSGWSRNTEKECTSSPTSYHKLSPRSLRPHFQLRLRLGRKE
jgi:hypothetical protein